MIEPATDQVKLLLLNRITDQVLWTSRQGSKGSRLVVTIERIDMHDYCIISQAVLKMDKKKGERNRPPLKEVRNRYPDLLSGITQDENLNLYSPARLRSVF